MNETIEIQVDMGQKTNLKFMELWNLIDQELSSVLINSRYKLSIVHVSRSNFSTFLACFFVQSSYL